MTVVRDNNYQTIDLTKNDTPDKTSDKRARTRGHEIIERDHSIVIISDTEEDVTSISDTTNRKDR